MILAPGLPHPWVRASAWEGNTAEGAGASAGKDPSEEEQPAAFARASRRDCPEGGVNTPNPPPRQGRYAADSSG